MGVPLVLGKRGAYIKVLSKPTLMLFVKKPFLFWRKADVQLN